MSQLETGIGRGAVLWEAAGNMEVPDGSDACKQIAFWLKSFEQAALDAHPTIRAIPPRGSDIPADLQLGFAPKRLLEVRPRLVLAAVDLLRLLTSPRPTTTSEAGAG